VSAQAAAATVTVHRTLAPEDAARADFYALIARLLQRAPDAMLLADLAAAPLLPAEGDRAMADAWRELVEASATAQPGDVAFEYDELFAGVGKAPVSIYAGFYSGAPAVDHPRVRIRGDLAQLGLAPQVETEPEDHFGVIFDAMRVLVAGGAGRGPASVAEQRRFFERHVRPAAPRFLAAVGVARQSHYYRRVAALAAAFVALETESFQLD
jgi:TorA maturation chaperone TorD